MSIAAELQQEALILANENKERVLDFERDKLRVKMELDQIQAKIDTASRARQRLPKFRPEIGSEYQCPRCWINYERRAALLPINSEISESKVDHFECRKCGYEISVFQ